jgi:FkbM family methyltransferase
MTDWIDAFPPEAVFWDIGANLGVYTLYAASKGIKTCAFEPEAASLYLLQKNLDLNSLHHKVIALNMAVGESTAIYPFKLADSQIGTPRHQVRMDANAAGRAVLMMTGSDLVQDFALPAPTHIRIDVGGSELSVVKGLNFSDSALREIGLKLRRNGQAPEIVAALERSGFQTAGAVDALASAPNVLYFIFRRN